MTAIFGTGKDIRNGVMDGIILDHTAWAQAQWHGVQLGDKRLVRRVVQMGAAMAAAPEASLPKQLGNWSALRAAYGILNDQRWTLERLATPHWQLTRGLAQQYATVLFVQDTSELDYTHHASKANLGQIGDGRGRGLLLHTTLAIVPEEVAVVLGVAHQQVVRRQPKPKPKPHYTASPEGQLWATAAAAVGQAPPQVRWVHVGDRGSDDFRFMHECRQQQKDFLVRAMHNRLLHLPEVEPGLQKLMDYARSLPARLSYTLDLPARHKQPARTAHMRLAWTPVTIPAPPRSPKDLVKQLPMDAWIVRAWEVEAPPEVKEAIDWILITSVPTLTVTDALERVRWYTCRWLVEDYHQCLKTGCAIEQRQLDDGADIERLLGFLGPIAGRLLQLRNLTRALPEAQAITYIDPLVIQMLQLRLPHLAGRSLTIAEFWRAVAQLGGHLGRRRDGPPGWRTIWQGWQELTALAQGARLYAAANPANSTT